MEIKETIDSTSQTNPSLATSLRILFAIYFNINERFYSSASLQYELYDYTKIHLTIAMSWNESELFMDLAYIWFFQLLFITCKDILLCALFFDLSFETNILVSVVVVVDVTVDIAVDVAVDSGCVDSAVDFPILDRYLMLTK